MDDFGETHHKDRTGSCERRVGLVEDNSGRPKTHIRNTHKTSTHKHKQHKQTGVPKFETNVRLETTNDKPSPSSPLTHRHWTLLDCCLVRSFVCLFVASFCTSLRVKLILPWFEEHLEVTVRMRSFYLMMRAPSCCLMTLYFVHPPKNNIPRRLPPRLALAESNQPPPKREDGDHVCLAGTAAGALESVYLRYLPPRDEVTMGSRGGRPTNNNNINHNHTPTNPLQVILLHATTSRLLSPP